MPRKKRLSEADAAAERRKKKIRRLFIETLAARSRLISTLQRGAPEHFSAMGGLDVIFNDVCQALDKAATDPNWNALADDLNTRFLKIR